MVGGRVELRARIWSRFERGRLVRRRVKYVHLCLVASYTHLLNLFIWKNLSVRIIRIVTCTFVVEDIFLFAQSNTYDKHTYDNISPTTFHHTA